MWNFGRHSQGPGGPRREAVEALCSLGMGGLSEALRAIFNDIATNLGIHPEFGADIHWLKETFKGLIGALTGAACIPASVIIANLSDDEVTAREWLILGWPIAFFFVQNSHDLLQICFGKTMTIRAPDGRFSDAVVRAWPNCYGALFDRERWLRAALPLAIAHYLHHHYAEQKPDELKRVAKARAELELQLQRSATAPAPTAEES